MDGTDGLHGCTNETVAEFSISLKTAGQAREAKGRGGGWMDGGRHRGHLFDTRASHITYIPHTHTCIHVWRLPATPVDFERSPPLFSYMHTPHHIHTWQGGGCCFARFTFTLAYAEDFVVVALAITIWPGRGGGFHYASGSVQ